MMKNLQLLILLIFMASGSFAQQYGWVALDPPENVRAIHRIYLEGNKAWLVADSSIFYSPNYPAVQFTRIYSTPANWGPPKLYDIVFRNENGKRYGWAVGSDSFGARSIDDSALVWVGDYIGGETNHLVSFANKSIGYFSGTDKSLYKTTDGGANWTEIYSGLSVSSVNALFFLDTLVGYLGSSSPSFRKTTDGGLTWFNAASITGSMMDIYFLDESHGWAVGASDIMIYRNATWNRVINTPLGTAMYSIFFVDQNNGWRVGLEGKIFHSNDGGFTWNEETSGTTKTLHDVYFTSPTNGFAVGFDSTILHYTQITGVEEHPAQPTAFNLEQNFPNPFDSETKISYSLAIPAQVQLTVCNMFGQQVALLDEGFKPAGSFSADFSGDGLPSGIYYYRLQCGDRHETRKMTLIK